MANSNQYEMHVRKMFSDTFDDAVRDVADDAMKDPFLGGMMVQAAIGTTYDSLKNNDQLEGIGMMMGLDIQEILEDECQKAMKRFLE